MAKTKIIDQCASERREGMSKREFAHFLLSYLEEHESKISRTFYQATVSWLLVEWERITKGDGDNGSA